MAKNRYRDSYINDTEKLIEFQNSKFTMMNMTKMNDWPEHMGYSDDEYLLNKIKFK